MYQFSSVLLFSWWKFCVSQLLLNWIFFFTIKFVYCCSNFNLIYSDGNVSKCAGIIWLLLFLKSVGPSQIVSIYVGAGGFSLILVNLGPHFMAKKNWVNGVWKNVADKKKNQKFGILEHMRFCCEINSWIGRIFSVFL